MKYKWLLFDADGTLFDYNRAETEALEKTFKQIGQRFELRYAQVYKQINAQIWLEFEAGKISQGRLRIKRFELLLEAIELESSPEIFSQRYLKNLSDNADLIEGAEEVVRRLSDKVDLMVITNGLTDVQRSRFAKSPISDYFADIVISEEVGAAKPDKKIFDEAFRRMNFPRKAEVLIVGDSLTSDIQGGNNYGIDACWFNPAQKPCDQNVEIQYEISHLRDLLAIVESA